MCGLLLFFFFYKEKTAYEMRISDWSSDVGSSDLLVGGDEDRALVRRAREIGEQPGQEAGGRARQGQGLLGGKDTGEIRHLLLVMPDLFRHPTCRVRDRKSTRLNSIH